MVYIIGVDPGATTGLVCYHPDTHRVEMARSLITSALDSASSFAALGRVLAEWKGVLIDAKVHVVLEQPRGYGATRPEVVDSAFVAGLAFAAARAYPEWACITLERRHVTAQLSIATRHAIRVTNDKTAWQAVKLLHGLDPVARLPRDHTLASVKDHERAALAVVVSYSTLVGYTG